MYHYVVRDGRGVAVASYGIKDLAVKAVEAGIGSDYVEVPANKHVYFLTKGLKHYQVIMKRMGNLGAKIINSETCPPEDYNRTMSSITATLEYNEAAEHLIIKLWAHDEEDLFQKCQDVWKKWEEIELTMNPLPTFDEENMKPDERPEAFQPANTH